MEVTVLLFGPLTELFGEISLKLADLPDTETMINRLEQQYPEFSGQSYVVAVDQQIVHENTTLHSGQTIALLPPFSGG